MDMENQSKIKKEEIELTPQELQEIYTIREFSNKYVTSYGRDNKEAALEIEGMYLWLSGVEQSNGISLKRNQLPEKVQIVINKHGQPELRMFDKNGDIKNGMRFGSWIGYDLYICKTEKQARYMYNKSLEKAISVIDNRIEELEKVKERLSSLKLDLSN